MTPAEAAAVFREAVAAQKSLAPTLREAKKVLNKYFDDNALDELDGVRRAVDVREQLDTDKVRDFLGDQVGEFLKKVTSRTLYLAENV
jgi:hypothetical protein